MGRSTQTGTSAGSRGQGRRDTDALSARGLAFECDQGQAVPEAIPEISGTGAPEPGDALDLHRQPASGRTPVRLSTARWSDVLDHDPAVFSDLTVLGESGLLEG